MLGDAYEYLMKHFAVESGKSKGQFYTPAEVSRIMAKVIDAHKADTGMHTVYDPTCGSGSLLLKIAEEAKQISIYGQELDNATADWQLLICGFMTSRKQKLKKDKAHFQLRFLLNTAHYKLSTMLSRIHLFLTNRGEMVLTRDHDPYDRFTGFGIPPKKNGDYAFFYIF